MRKRIRTMIFDNRYLSWLYDFLRGIHSRIPLCCTLFYANYCFKNPMSMTGYEVSKARKMPRGCGPGYVECEKCAERTLAGYRGHHRHLCLCQEGLSWSCRAWSWFQQLEIQKPIPLLEQFKMMELEPEFEPESLHHEYEEEVAV